MCIIGRSHSKYPAVNTIFLCEKQCTMLKIVIAELLYSDLTRVIDMTHRMFFCSVVICSLKSLRSLLIGTFVTH